MGVCVNVGGGDFMGCGVGDIGDIGRDKDKERVVED